MHSDPGFWKVFARTHEDEWCRALSTLLSFDTVSGDPDPKAHQYWRQKIAEGFAYLNDLARNLGFVTRGYQDRVLVIEMPARAGAPVLGFPIHLDVVPAGEGWTRNPFGGEIAQGAIWGRGAQDDKGPIIQTLFGLLGAVELSRQTGRGFQKTVRLIIVSEEECGQWDDIPFYFDRERPPDFSIVPDAEFPITNGEKGVQNLHLDFEWSPPLKGQFDISAGERANVVPAKARLQIGGEALDGTARLEHLGHEIMSAPKKPEVSRKNGAVELLFHGTGAHGSLPHKGYNAATDALSVAAMLPGLRSHPAGTVMSWLAQAAGSLDGSFLGIAHRHEKVGRTTVNLGVLRVNLNSSHAVLNIRNPIGLPGAEVERRVREAVGHLREAAPGLDKAAVANERGAREPIYVDPGQFAEWINPMREAYTATTGREATLQSIGGTTFAKAFPNAVCFGPVDPNDEVELAHEADEHVTLAAMRRNVEIYGRAIEGIALG